MYLKTLRHWLFRLIVAVVCSIMIWSFTIPWWTARITSVSPVGERFYQLNIYGWGIPSPTDINLVQYIAQDVTPIYQTYLAWAYVGISITAALVSTYLKGKKGQLLLGISGIGLVVYALVAAFMVIATRLNELGIAFQGTSSYQSAHILSSLRFGFYLACITGSLFIVLAFVRNIIVGKSKE